MKNKTEILSIELRNECLKKSSPPELEKIKMLIALGADPNYSPGENKSTCLVTPQLHRHGHSQRSIENSLN